ncbi:MAG: radical SAM protein [Acidobacteriota bacterium]
MPSLPVTLPSTRVPSPSPVQELPPIRGERSFVKEHAVLARMAWRAATGLSPKVAWKAAHLYAYKGAKAIWSYKRRLGRGELYPPFMFIALTNTCNLRCHGCWVEKEGTAYFIGEEDLDRIIETGKKHNAYYYTLLGGEPFMFKGIWDVFERHSDCYFQVITNGMLFTPDHVERLRRAGNVTPLISLDGWRDQNDLRRGDGVWEAALAGLERLQRAKLLFGIATTATGLNMHEVMSDEYVRFFSERGAMYLWYYVYRPMGEEQHPEYCVSKEQLIWMRQRLLELRRTQPMLIIDTYWTADGEAFCPAAMGLGYHIGPRGSIEICPALSFAAETVRDGDDLYDTFNESQFLRGFQKFVTNRTKGCVILEHPQELHDYIQGSGAEDFSGRESAFQELNGITPRHSHHLPGEEIPEDFWLYRLLKKNVFFGMGAIG